MTKKIKVLIEQHQEIQIHNDLWNVAQYLVERIEVRTANNETAGIAFDIMAALTMIAFAMEAKINFVGWKTKGEAWKERQPTQRKVAEVLQWAKIFPDDTTRPYSTIAELRKFRDQLAHGKPKIVSFTREVLGSPDEMERLDDLTGDWEKFVSIVFLRQAYEDLDAIWNDLVRNLKIDRYDTLTRGGGSMRIIEQLED